MAAVQYASPELIPARLRRVALILDSGGVAPDGLRPADVIVYQPSDTLPADVVAVGAVLYAASDAIPPNMVKISGRGARLIAAGLPDGAVAGWTGGAVASGKHIITPTAGAELVDGWTNNVSYPFETFTPGSGSAITQAVNTTGYGICYKDVGVVIVGEWFRIAWNLTLNSGTVPYVRTSRNNTSNVPHNFNVLAGVAGANVRTYKAANAETNQHAVYMADTGQATDFAVADYSLKRITLSTLHSVTALPGLANLDVSATAAAFTVGMQMGVVARLDDPATPANGLYAYTNNTTVYCDQLLAGVWSNLGNGAAAYVAGVLPKLVIRDTTVTLMYNGSVIWSGTYNAAVAGDYYGGLSTHASNQFATIVITGS